MMKKTSGRLQIRKYLIMGLLGLGVVFSGGECQAYFNGAPAYNANYRPINARQGVETYVDVSTMHTVFENNTWLKFSVVTVIAKEDTDVTTIVQDFKLIKINKQTREAWVSSTVDAEGVLGMAVLNDKINWRYLELNKQPAGYELSSFTMVNVCYNYKYGEFLNDTSGTAASAAKWYKGE